MLSTVNEHEYDTYHKDRKLNLRVLDRRLEHIECEALKLKKDGEIHESNKPTIFRYRRI
jgi:hypothetical protein